jgi:hypothetical protein
MNFPLSIFDISLWLAVSAIILLITSELLFSLPEFSARAVIDKERLRQLAIGCGIGFIVTVILHIFQPL